MNAYIEDKLIKLIAYTLSGIIILIVLTVMYGPFIYLVLQADKHSNEYDYSCDRYTC